ncbi:MAG: peptide/nickel transport system permease protein [Thermoanaerobacteraceae bacterium]|nr:peptide/nickel transport system permease protein [Thermoanaerobacteraceae bacterium]MDN5302951.1 peptide/nickel transport system permease protein [Thermoanaerobacteraceae bacterium]MDN5312264.1 peptide/nickel transport system permease protein [Thermoanaerobacteraceae bacterium]
MLRYFIKRLLLMIPVILGMTIIVFLILHLSPGDPVDLIVGPNVTPEVYASIRQKYGLDQPLIVQYIKFLSNVARGDLGTSILQQRPVSELILQRFPITLELGLTGLVLSFLIAIPVGVSAAVKRNTIVDYSCMTGAMLGMSLPTFWFGLLLLYFFAYKLRWFPISGYGTWRHLVLPGFAIGLTDAAITARMVRSSMLEVLRQDYIRTARSKGLAEMVVTYQHALKNAMIPIITLLGLRVGWIIGGSVMLEIVFSRPGLGRLMVDSILARDYPVVQGAMIVLTTSIILGNILADLLYAVFDPRIRYN